VLAVVLATELPASAWPVLAAVLGNGIARERVACAFFGNAQVCLWVAWSVGCVVCGLRGLWVAWSVVALATHGIVRAVRSTCFAMQSSFAIARSNVLSNST
jgi:hypothetical protein